MGVTVVTKLFDTLPSYTKSESVSWYVGKMQCQFNRT